MEDGAGRGQQRVCHRKKHAAASGTVESPLPVFGLFYKVSLFLQEEDGIFVPERALEGTGKIFFKAWKIQENPLPQSASSLLSGHSGPALRQCCKVS